MMRFRQINIESVVNYDDFQLDFGEKETGLHIIYGPNETGKSTLLQVLIDILFGGKADANLYHSKSRISALLDHQGDLHPVHRKKRYSKIEIDKNRESLTDDEILELLGGYTKEQFQLLFGFDHDRLRDGGESLLQSKGQAGISLFESGGGLQYLQKLLTELSDRSRELLDPSFKSNSARKINRALRAYNEAMQTVRDVSLRGDYYQRLRTEIEEKRHRVNALREQKEQLQLEIRKLERIKRTRNIVVSLEELRAAFTSLENVEVLPEDLDERIPTSIQQLNGERANLKNLTEQKNGLVTDIDSLHIDENVLDHREEIQSLNEEVRQFSTRKNEEIPADELQLEQKTAEAKAILKGLAPGVPFSQAETLRIPFIDEEEIVQLANEINDLQTSYQNLMDRLKEEQSELRKKEDELKQLGSVNDGTALNLLLREIQRAGDIEKILENKERELNRKRQEIEGKLQQQSLWTNDAVELKNTPLPLLETIEFYQNQWQDFEKELVDLQEKLNSTNDELRRTIRQLDEIDLSGKVPVEEELLDVREKRDYGWQLIKKVWLKGEKIEEKVKEFAADKPLAVAYEQFVEQADEIADVMRKQSDRSAQRAQLLLKKKHLEEEIRHVQDNIAARREEFAQLQEDWLKEWAPCGIHAKQPAEMHDWYMKFYQPMMTGLDELQMLETEYSSLYEQKTEYEQRLKNELKTIGVEVREQFTINHLIQIAEETIEEIDSQRNRARYVQDTIKEMKGKLGEQKRNLDQIEKQIAEKKQMWELLRMKHPQLPENPEIAPAYIEQLRKLFSLIDEINRKRAEIDRKKEAVQQFEERAKKLAEHLQEDLAAFLSYEHFVRHLRDRLGRANEVKSNQLRMQEELQKLEEAIAQQNRQVNRLQEEIDRYLAKYHCQNEDELLRLVEKSKEYKKLEGEIKTKERLLKEAGDHLPIAQLEHEVKDAPNEVIVDERLNELNQELKQIDETFTKENQNLGELVHEINQLDGSDTKAADIAQQAETYLSEVDRHWHEYLRVEVAKQLLQKTIDRFREENESTVIRRAGEYFQKLTLHAYQGLAIEYEDMDPYIEALQVSGEKLLVQELSDGTRDQLYLALRLAFIDQHFDSNQPLPLIMDDILVNFDDHRSKATLQVLAELAEKTQIIYFTHHLSIVEIGHNLPNTKIHNLEILKEEAVSR